MKLFLAITLYLCSSVLTVAQESILEFSEGSSFTLTITSEDSTNSSVDFTGVYSHGGPSIESKLVNVMEKTPYEVNIPGTVFLGLFQSGSPDQRISVRLTKYVDGKLLGHTAGSGGINLVRADEHGMVYGLPTRYDEFWGAFGGSKK